MGTDDTRARWALMTPRNGPRALPSMWLYHYALMCSIAVCVVAVIKK